MDSKIKMVACPRCGGSPDMDEDGKFFTCYFCCDEGVVTEAVAAEESRSRAWGAYLEAEKAILLRVKLGIPSAATKWWIDEYEGPVWTFSDRSWGVRTLDDGRILDSKTGAEIVPAYPMDDLDDIPF